MGRLGGGKQVQADHSSVAWAGGVRCRRRYDMSTADRWNLHGGLPSAVLQRWAGDGYEPEAPSIAWGPLRQKARTVDAEVSGAWWRRTARDQEQPASGAVG